MGTLRRRRRIPGPVLEAIEGLALRGFTPAQIDKELASREMADIPTTRTIRRIVADLAPRDPSTPWHLQDADDEAALVLPVLAEVIVQSEGRTRTLTRGEADWIARIRRAAPDYADLFRVYSLARLALSGKPERVEYELAFGRWRSNEDAARWWKAIENGWLGTVLLGKTERGGEVWGYAEDRADAKTREV